MTNFPICTECVIVNPKNATYCVRCGRKLTTSLDTWLENMVKRWSENIDRRTNCVKTDAVNQTMHDIETILGILGPSAKIGTNMADKADEICQKLESTINPYITQYDNKPVNVLEALKELMTICLSLEVMYEEVLTTAMQFWADSLPEFSKGRIPHYEIGEENGGT